MHLSGSFSVTVLLSIQVLQLFDCSEPFRLTGLLILYLKNTYQKWRVVAEAINLHDLVEHLIVTLKT